MEDYVLQPVHLPSLKALQAHVVAYCCPHGLTKWRKKSTILLLLLTVLKQTTFNTMQIPSHHIQYYANTIPPHSILCKYHPTTFNTMQIPSHHIQYYANTIPPHSILCKYHPTTFNTMQIPSHHIQYYANTIP